MILRYRCVWVGVSPDIVHREINRMLYLFCSVSVSGWLLYCELCKAVWTLDQDVFEGLFVCRRSFFPWFLWKNSTQTSSAIWLSGLGCTILKPANLNEFWLQSMLWWFFFCSQLQKSSDPRLVSWAYPAVLKCNSPQQQHFVKQLKQLSSGNGHVWQIPDSVLRGLDVLFILLHYSQWRWFFCIFAKAHLVGCRDVCALYKIYTYMYNTIHYKPKECFNSK